MTEVIKILSTIDLINKYSWTISNADIDAAENLRLISI